MLNINNNFVLKSCPLCAQATIYKAGNITYGSPTYFSSQEISVTLKPELWRCKNCKSGFVQNTIPEKIATSLYQEGFSSERWSSFKFEESKCQEVINALENIFCSGARVLDVGCNTGELLDFAKEKGCKTFGVEYSLTSRNIIEAKGHIGFSNLFEVDETYDAIAAFDLVEHLYNLPIFIEACYEKLNSNGCLILLTGNINSASSLMTNSKWWYMGYPEHIVFPSKYYFKFYSKFKLQTWMPTYASKNYRNAWLSTLKTIAKSCLLNKYNGLPSMGKDHALIILKKN